MNNAPVFPRTVGELICALHAQGCAHGLTDEASSARASLELGRLLRHVDGATRRRLIRNCG